LGIPTTVKISLPLDRTVFQQDKNAKNAPFVLAGQVLGYYPGGGNVAFQIESLDKMGAYVSTTQSWTAISHNATGFFSRTLTLSTGWYKITVQFLNQTTSIKVGIGEVIFVAGQSNAQGIDYGSIPNLGTDYDCINAVNQNCWCKKTYPFPKFDKMEYTTDFTIRKVAPNGNQTLWAYQALGKRIVDGNTTAVTPVMVFNSGSGGTGIDNWSKTAGESPNLNGDNVITTNPFGYLNCKYDDPNTPVNERWNSEGPEGHPYRGLKTALNYYGGMLGARAVIWHQGESDTKLRAETPPSPDAANYTGKLQNVIDKTRLHFNANLSWAISRVSRFTANSNVTSITNNNLKADQTTVKNNGGATTTWGAYYSDEIDGADRVDKLHFSATGLSKLAELYATGNFTGNTAGGTQGGDILTMPTVPASGLAPTVTVTKNGTNINMSVNGTFTNTNFFWVKNEAKMSAFITNGQSNNNIPNTGTDRWRCYVQDATGNVLISQEVALPIEEGIVTGPTCPTGSFVAVSDKITCDEISGWLLKGINTTQSGEMDIYVDGQKVESLPANSYKVYTVFGLPISTNEGYIKAVPVNASWKDGLSHQIAVYKCGFVPPYFFASATLTCPIYTLLTVNNPTGLTSKSASGGTGYFTVSSANVTWSISGIPTWASVSPSSGTNGNTGVTVTFQNNTGAARSATLTITGNNGVSNQTVAISQQAGSSGSTCVSCQGNSFNDNDLIGYGNGIAVRVKIESGCAKAYWSGGNGNSFTHQNWLPGLTGKTLSDAVLNSCVTWDGIPSNCANNSPCGGSCSSPTPTLSANPTSISAGQTSTLTASGCTGTVSWSNGTTGVTTSVSAVGTYTATCTNSGCTISAAGSVPVGATGTLTCVTCQNNTFSDNDLIGYGNGVAVRVKIINGCAKAYWSGGNGNSFTHQNWLPGLTGKTVSDAVLNSCVSWDGIPSNCGNNTPCSGGCVGGNFTGYLDVASCNFFGGWSFDWNDLNRTVQVDIFVDGQKVATVNANEPRSDLGTAFNNSACIPHGYTYYFPAGAWWKNGQQHTITARTCGGTQDLSNSPLYMNCGPGSRLSSEPTTVSVSESNGTIENNRRIENIEDDFSTDPNPSTGSITVYFSGGEGESGKLRVSDILGREILQMNILANKATIVEVPAQFEGNTFFNLQTNRFTKTRKVLIIR
jgi:Carbohydrate esterase, sialic acid-specific acetylesterase